MSGMNGRRVLWGVGSHRTMRPHWALHELSVPYETEPIGSRSGETQTAEYSLLNPRQKIPLLQDGEFTIAESPAIIIYLAEAYSGGKVQLIPDGQRARAQLLEWSLFIAMELDATSLYVVRRHSGLKSIYGAAPAAIDAAKAYFFEQLGHVDQALRGGGALLLWRWFTYVALLVIT